MDLYQQTVQYLTSGFEVGYKRGSKIKIAKKDRLFRKKITENIHFFSAAKTLKQVEELRSLIEVDGKLVPFQDFKQPALQVLQGYNQNWLQTEYNACIGQSQMASVWQQFDADKKDLPLLRYSTVGDSQVRDSHRILDGIVRPVDDPFWDRYAPLNGWNCRCELEQLEEGKTTDLSDFENLSHEDQPPAFRFNPGKKLQVFGDDHPYFDYDPAYNEYIKSLIVNGSKKSSK